MNQEQTNDTNQNFNMDIAYNAIYKAIAEIKPEYQRIVYEGFSIKDLYNILADDQQYFKCQTEIVRNAAQYINLYTTFEELRMRLLGMPNVQEN